MPCLIIYTLVHTKYPHFRLPTNLPRNYLRLGTSLFTQNVSALGSLTAAVWQSLITSVSSLRNISSSTTSSHGGAPWVYFLSARTMSWMGIQEPPISLSIRIWIKNKLSFQIQPQKILKFQVVKINKIQIKIVLK